MLTILNQNWYNSQWNNITLGTYTYNGNGDVLTSLTQGWNSTGSGGWTNAGKNIYTYDANGYKTNWLMQSWYSGQWVNAAQFTYTNNSNGKVLTSLYQNWLQSNSTWTNYYQSTCTYDANGNELTGYNTQWSNSSWQPADHDFDVNINGNDYYFNGYAINISYILVNTTGILADNNIIKGYSLSQNYPNPFNPSTNISFNIPSKSFVSLRIFDLLGKEVATIVSEEMSAGSYSREWNASAFSSGVYFYRLTAGNFVQTRKLCLLR
jgi:hypothetical protein